MTNTKRSTVTAFTRPSSKVRRPRLTTLQKRFSDLVKEYVQCTGSASEHMRLQEAISETRREIEARVKAFVRTARVAA